MTNKTATALLAMMIGLTMLTCLCYAAIFVQPDVAFNPYPPQYATARTEATLEAIQSSQVFQVNTPTPDVNATPTSGWEPTWTPTATPSPTLSPTPTETKTPTPTRTPTATSTQFPTPTSTVTNTPLPPPPPTSTPPPAFIISGRQTEANCYVVRVKGQVFDSSGLPVSGVPMQVGEVGVAGSIFTTAPTDANGRYAYDFGSPDSNKHTWFVVPMEGGQPSPGVQRFEFQTDPIEVCDLTSAIQIVSVDWRKRATLQ